MDRIPMTSQHMRRARQHSRAIERHVRDAQPKPVAATKPVWLQPVEPEIPFGLPLNVVGVEITRIKTTWLYQNGTRRHVATKRLPAMRADLERLPGLLFEFRERLASGDDSN
jgi:hypothetical protein